MSAARIPLFPLNIVLFPARAVPLHIFEPRYREMTRHCIATQSPFGVVFTESNKPANVGCTALIQQTVKEYEDGRSDILTVAQRVFRWLRLHNDKPYFEADVEFVEDTPETPDPDQARELETLFRQCHRILSHVDPPAHQAGESFAYHVGSELPLDNPFRQNLLELRSERERQRSLIERLSDWKPQLQQREHVRAKATGNGHGKL